MSILKQMLTENEEYDFGHIPKPDEMINDDSEEYDFGHIPKLDDQEDQLDTSNIHKSTRILGIDKSKINKKLKDISELPEQKAMPLSKIKEVLKEYGIQTVLSDTKFKGKTGNVDFNLIKNGKLVKNCRLIIYWNTTEDRLSLNIYLG